MECSLEPRKHEVLTFSSYLDPSMAMASGWADLPDDLLDMVGQRTPSIKDYVRLRAVCKSWRSFLRPKSTPPWLMLPYDPRGESCTRGFLDVSDGTVHELDLPETRGKRCCGSSHGWLVLERWPDMWLLNPANRARVQLPSLTRRGEAWPCSRFMQRGARERWEDCAYRGFRRPLSEPEVRRASLSSDPSVDGSCTVMVLLATEEAVFCKPTDASWRTIAFALGAFSAIDVTFQNGAFRLVSHYGRVAAFDLVSPLREVPTRRDALHALAHTWDGQCLVQRRGGELLMAAWSGGGRELAVFRLGSDGWWMEAGDDVGEDVVFLGSKDTGGLAFAMETCVDGKGSMFDSSKLTNLPCFLKTRAMNSSSICSDKATETPR